MTVNSYEKSLKIFIKAQSMLDQPFYLFWARDRYCAIHKNGQGLILK